MKELTGLTSLLDNPFLNKRVILSIFILLKFLQNQLRAYPLLHLQYY
jgi:hypothetical protein